MLAAEDISARGCVIESDSPTVIANLVFIEHVALPLVCSICNPDTPDGKSTAICLLVKLIPKWLVELLESSELSLPGMTGFFSTYFRKAIGVSSNDRDGIRPQSIPVKRNVLLYM